MSRKIQYYRLIWAWKKLDFLILLYLWALKISCWGEHGKTHQLSKPLACASLVIVFPARYIVCEALRVYKLKSRKSDKFAVCAVSQNGLWFPYTSVCVCVCVCVCDYYFPLFFFFLSFLPYPSIRSFLVPPPPHRHVLFSLSRYRYSFITQPVWTA